MNCNTCFHLLSVLLIQYFIVSLAMSFRNLATDQFALLKFKDHILDPQNILANNWTTSSSACNWVGVSCGVKHGRVTSLNLPNMSLTGTIPPNLGNLSFLLHLDLSSNNFSGHIPRELGQLRRLRFIHLSHNGLTGEIPPWLGNLHRVEKLGMRYNNFTGTIPQRLVNMSNLEILDLGFNQLFGRIPYSIFKISSLKEIYLDSNSLSGSLPDDVFDHLPKLEILYLYINKLSGYIPSSVSKCSNLQMLVMSANQFSGHLPRNIGNLTRLNEVYFGFNNLEGQIPASIFNISSLNVISLSNNSLSGSIPSSIDNCYNLQALKISRNLLTGPIRESIMNSTMIEHIILFTNNLEGNLAPISKNSRLQELLLQENNLSGNILDSISNASRLQWLDIADNYFSGLIPNTLGNLRHLEWFEIGNNHFTTESATHEWSFLSSLENCRNLRAVIVSGNPLDGVLPTYIGNLSTSLQQFYANGCKLEGNIPLEVSNLSNIFVLELRNNKMIGSIPETIRGMRNLQALRLSGNKLGGSITQSVCGLEKLYDFILSFNKFYGPIPTCLGNLTSLRYLYLDSNKLRSAIPSTLWNLKDILEIDLSSNYLNYSHTLDVGDLRSLLKLNLSRNLLTADVSSSIGGLKTLVSLDLSNNKFHGHIPESFGGLISLEFLDLCNNNFSGVIPKSLEKLSNLHYFNVSFNRLEGEIPTRGCFPNFSSTSFMKNFALCGPHRLLVLPCRSRIQKNYKMIILRDLRYGLPAIAMVVVIIVLTIMGKKCRNRRTTVPVTDDLSSLKSWRRISQAELSQATGGFDECNMLGSGSFGYVYKGRLSDGTDVAIKVFNLQIEGAFKSFDVECEAMRNIVHRNLVKVITCCSNVDFKALVLDFMSNGSLEKWLHSENGFLDILQRINIMIDVATALEYLHSGHPTPIIHCDLKPSNILLDEDMVAHVGDFGVAKLLGEGDLMTQTMTLATIGYMAPEFGSAGIVSIKCDIYSYGIVLIETFTTKKPTDEIFTEAMTMRYWMKMSLSKGMIDIADADLLREEDDYFIVKANCISSIMELALDCSSELPEERKDMKDVVVELKKIKKKFLNSIEHVK